MLNLTVCIFSDKCPRGNLWIFYFLERLTMNNLIHKSRFCCSIFLLCSKNRSCVCFIRVFILLGSYDYAPEASPNE